MMSGLEADVLVLGAGAAGLMAAIECGKRGRRTVLLDHADRAGKKILISGGGRCNFTNLHTTAENFLSDNPHFCKSALARYTAADFIALVEKHRIPYHEKTLGQLFCDRSARDIVALLERECVEAGVDVRLGTTIDSVAHLDPGFQVTSSLGGIRTDAIVVATGGLSIPKMGATGLGYDIARKFGLHIVPPRPALVPLTFTADDLSLWAPLAGLSTEVIASIPSQAPSAKVPAFREKLLITHRGLSGPAVLQISSFWQGNRSIAIDLAPDKHVFGPMLSQPAHRNASSALAALRGVLPSRMAESWLQTNPPRDYTNRALAEAERTLHAWCPHIAGTEGYAKAEVTAGGVSTACLDARTLQAKTVAGLYFVGEVVDVTGWLGGYNFQWAWASGFCAGQVA